MFAITSPRQNWKLCLFLRRSQFSKTLTRLGCMFLLQSFILWPSLLMTVDMPVACHETNRTECFVPKPKFYADNGTAEVAAADRYANKIFMIKAVSSKYEVVNKPHWQTASSDTGYLSFPGAYSAVCWYTGKALFEKLGGDTPVGLLQTSVGGYVVRTCKPAYELSSFFLLLFFCFTECHSKC